MTPLAALLEGRAAAYVTFARPIVFLSVPNQSSFFRGSKIMWRTVLPPLGISVFEKKRRVFGS